MRPVGRLDLAHRHRLPTLTSAHLFPAILYDEETERLLGEILCPTQTGRIALSHSAFLISSSWWLGQTWRKTSLGEIE